MKGWLARGRKVHRQSMQRQFAPWLKKRDAAEQRALLECLVAACDVYVWKLLRRDLARSRNEAEARVRQMVAAILARGKRSHEDSRARTWHAWRS